MVQWVEVHSVPASRHLSNRRLDGPPLLKINPPSQRRRGGVAAAENQDVRGTRICK